jgi:trans-2,3-dihydro-3-hydroxyanthranilate isomerase
MQLDYHCLDVFTDTPLAGNPLAVVLEADALGDDLMQRVAREFGFSETVFLTRPLDPTHSARMRIFTPRAEVPFAGHPTVGTAVLLADLRGPSSDGSRSALVVLEQGIGIVRAGVRLASGRPAFAEFDTPRLPERLADLATPDLLADALGLIPSEIGFANHKPTQFAAGNAFAFVPVASLDAIAEARVVQAAWQAAFAGHSILGVMVYCRQTRHAGADFHARVFAPDFGVAEDPATGSAAAAFAGVIQHFDALPAGTHRRRIEQGYEMGRPSQVELELVVAERRLSAVRIGGHAVRVMRGTLTL